MNYCFFLIPNINTINSVIASVMKWSEHNKTYMPYNVHIKSECHSDRYCSVADKSPSLQTPFSN